MTKNGVITEIFAVAIGISLGMIIYDVIKHKILTQVPNHYPRHNNDDDIQWGDGSFVNQ